MKIAVAGTGYVGLSMATLLAQHNDVAAVDIVPEKVALINRGESPIQDEYIEKFLKEKDAEQKEAEKAQEEYEKTHGYSGEKLTEYQNRYNLAYDFYMSLSPDIAVNALKSATNMQYYLGNYYDKLLSALKSRAANVNGSRRTYV